MPLGVKRTAGPPLGVKRTAGAAFNLEACKHYRYRRKAAFEKFDAREKAKLSKKLMAWCAGSAFVNFMLLAQKDKVAAVRHGIWAGVPPVITDLWRFRIKETKKETNTEI